MSLLLVDGSATFYFAAIISVSWNALFVKTLHVSLQKILCVCVGIILVELVCCELISN